jgi:hypothetical protein
MVTCSVLPVRREPGGPGHVHEPVHVHTRRRVHPLPPGRRPPRASPVPPPQWPGSPRCTCRSSGHRAADPCTRGRRRRSEEEVRKPRASSACLAWTKETDDGDEAERCRRMVGDDAAHLLWSDGPAGEVRAAEEPHARTPACMRGVAPWRKAEEYHAFLYWALMSTYCFPRKKTRCHLQRLAVLGPS